MSTQKTPKTPEEQIMEEEDRKILEIMGAIVCKVCWKLVDVGSENGCPYCLAQGVMMG